MRTLRFPNCGFLPVLAFVVMANSGFAQEHSPVGAAASESGNVGVTDAASGNEHETVPGGHDYSKPPLQFEVEMFLFTLAFFALFVFGMRSAVWLPLVKSLNSREVRIAQAETDARSARQQVEQLQAQANQQLTEVRARVGTMLDEARTQAEARKVEIVRQAEQEAQRIKAEALAEIEQARMAALQEMDQIVDRQAAAATEHLLGRAV